MKFVAIAFSLLTGVGAQAAMVTQEYSNVRSVDISGLEGTIEVLPSSSDSVQVSVDKKTFSDRCDLQIDKNDAAVTVRVSKGWVLGAAATCDADIRVLVPRSVSVTAYLAAGRLHVTGVANTVNLETSAANVVVDSVTSPYVTISTSSGSVDLKASEKARQVVSVKTTSGSMSYSSSVATNVKFKSLSGRFVGAERSSNLESASQVQFESLSGSFLWK